METLTREIYEYKGFKVIEKTAMNSAEIIKMDFYIYNKYGDLVSKNFNNPNEPIDILRKLALYLDEKRKHASGKDGI